MLYEFAMLVPEEANFLNQYNYDKLLEPQHETFSSDPILDEIRRKQKLQQKTSVNGNFVRVPILIHLESIISIEQSSKNANIVIVELDNGRQIVLDENYQDFSLWYKRAIEPQVTQISVEPFNG